MYACMYENKDIGKTETASTVRKNRILMRRTNNI